MAGFFWFGGWVGVVGVGLGMELWTATSLLHGHLVAVTSLRMDGWMDGWMG